jgi:RNA polymerase-binding transcription factor DksA
MAATPLTTAERLALRARLLDQWAQVEQQLASLVRTFDELVDAADLDPPDDEHDPDGTTAYERAQVISLAADARSRLHDLDHALAAVDDAGYGSCEQCGQPIGLARLEALPGTRQCVTCAAGAWHDLGR